jgi:hypothetical protein
MSTSSPFWIADQTSDIASVYSVNKTTGQPTILSLAPVISKLGGAPPPPPAEINGPTGQVATGAAGITTSSTDFNFTSGGATGKAAFLFSNLDGSISAWTSPSTPAASVSSVASDSFIGTPRSTSRCKVNGVQTLFVTYADQDTAGGVVDEFTTVGTSIKTLMGDTAGANLSAPSGLALAPGSQGQFGGDLLVANSCTTSPVSPAAEAASPGPSPSPSPAPDSMASAPSGWVGRVNPEKRPGRPSARIARELIGELDDSANSSDEIDRD